MQEHITVREGYFQKTARSLVYLSQGIEEETREEMNWRIDMTIRFSSKGNGRVRRF